MPTNQDETIARLTTLSLGKCLLRLSRVSAGAWQVAGVSVSAGTLRDALNSHDFTNQAAGVYFNLAGMSPVTAIMLFDSADLGCVSKCFTGHSFPHGGVITPADEIMLTELGNIVLNSLINSILNALRKSFMPALPLFAQGNRDAIAGEISKQVNPNLAFRIVASTLDLKSGTDLARVQVLVLLPEELALELELTQSSAGH